MAIDGVDHVGDFALRHQLVDEVERNLRLLRQHLAENGAARRGFEPLAVTLAVVIDAFPAILDLAVQRDGLFMQRVLDFAEVAIEALHDVLLLGIGLDVLLRMKLELPLPRRFRPGARGNRDRARCPGSARYRRAVGRVQNVVGRHHQHASFQLRLERQRHVHGHLVAVEVGVEGGADQRMKLDRLAFDQHRLERLDAEAVQRGRG